MKFSDQFERKETKDVANDLFPSQIDAEPTDIATEDELQHDEPETDSTEKQTDTQERYPRRNPKQPENLKDYYVDNGNELYDYCYFVNVPTNYDEAMSCKDAEKWKQAMDEEIETLEYNDVLTFRIAR